MTLLLAGLFLWCVVHFIPSMAADLRQQWINSWGNGKYRLCFALLIFSSIALMVFGWRSIEPQSLYAPLSWGRIAALGLNCSFA
jgi:uncharacterized membrane protein